MEGIRPWLMWLLPSLFFAYQFIVRIIPGLVMPDLMQKFEISASDYGIFASIYYVGYAGMQIPVALLLERYDPKKIISLFTLLCAIGTFCLVYTQHWEIALLSRFLMGVGSTVGFLGSSRMVMLWFKPEHFSRMMALNCTIGLLGVACAGRYANNAILKFGWEKTLFVTGIIGLGITLLLSIIISKPKDITKDITPDKKNLSIFKELQPLISEPKLMIAACANLLMVGAFEGFADVWGVSYLMITRGISKNEAALITSAIFMGMVCGGPILAYISDKFKAIYNVTSSCGFLIGAIFFVILFLNVHNNYILYLLLFIVGILCCYQVLVFSIGVSLVSKSFAGIAVAFLNCVNMLGGSFFHGVIGYTMDFFWAGQFENNIKLYDAKAYTYALIIIPVAAIFGGILFKLISLRRKPALVLKEMNKESSYDL